MSDDDIKISKFPDDRRREGLVILRAANDTATARPALRLPPVTRTLALACLLVFAGLYVYGQVAGQDKADNALLRFGFTPARYPHDLDLAALAAPVTYLFLHGGLAHLAVNTLSLAAFGTGVERWLGGRRMLGLYLLSGLAGAGAQYALTPDMAFPLIGASGAVSGLFGALIAGMNGAGTRGLILLAAVWTGSSLLFSWTGLPGAEGDISWASHLGGFATGLFLARVWIGSRRKNG